MILKIVQSGDPVLRRRAQPLSPAEMRSRRIRKLVSDMRDTMRKAPGVGLAAPQVGEPLQLFVVEDRVDKRNLDPKHLALTERVPVPFHVLANPKLTIVGRARAEFFEGCLSLAGYQGLVRRALEVRVDALDGEGNPVTIEARGWYARILQHETDHLDGVLCVDRMTLRTLTTTENHSKHWAGLSIDEVRRILEADRKLP